ncbi:hypothetical protein TVAG_119610 [Trichomonas vaginalis G3]|uniref:Tubby C-terminal domain-containing protein n=1 Tax=Trichomonas vaginalis (strain ATCC PRA-98 / G3) TaxID=412133 RepID=A2D7A7_TRIV3|nr:hypothetical protein TVAGG3_0992440 [Trichomonas vaginalis G3]EAY23624.1 hypothetical protein TVAG_119610 [Trichomonas vaginalis G3]KAI5490116.1 hypothetical protein TVAGG3_0992440 [Trichomonas vaginalis G3]|eukprot:XP_001276872.1 hypothetical protein [Trichomonas vaginalis G3]
MTFDSESSDDDEIVIRNRETVADQNRSRKRIKKKRKQNNENQANEETEITTTNQTNITLKPPIDQSPSRNYPPRKRLPKSPEKAENEGEERIPLEIKLDVGASNEQIPSLGLPKNQNIEFSDENEEFKTQTLVKSTSSDILSYHPLTYRITREVKLGWKGSRTHFQLYCGGIPQYHVKVKTLSIGECIKISAGNTSHLRDKSAAGYIIVDQDLLNASLRIMNQHGPEILSFKLHQSCQDYESKSAEATIKIDDENTFEYRSQPVDMLPDGPMIFEIPNVIPSIKNMILQDEKDRSSIIIGKVDKSALQIRADERIKPIIICAIAVILFLCKY